MNYKCPHCNNPAISVFKRFWLRRYMRFNCKSCGTQLRIHRRYLRRAAIGIIFVWFIVTLIASYYPFSNYVRIALYLVTLFASVSIFNLFVPFEEVEQEVKQRVIQEDDLEEEPELEQEDEQGSEEEFEQEEAQEVNQELEQEEEQKNNL